MENFLAAPYDDRSIRAHVHRTRELLSLSTLHASLSTSLALEYETAQNKASGSGRLRYSSCNGSPWFLFAVCFNYSCSFGRCSFDNFVFHFNLDTVRTEVPELDGLGFMEDVTGSLGKLLSSPSKEVCCVESIVFSSFNPPPSYRRFASLSINFWIIS